MRQIKFRAWHRGMKVMLDVFIVSTRKNAEGGYLPDCAGYGESGLATYFSFDEVDWMQTTGLTDKNGTEIYEEDVVRYTDYNTSDHEVKVANVYWMCWADWAKVPFLHPFGSPVAGEDMSGGRSLNTVFVTPSEACEVIGNVHENPELLCAQ